MSKQFCRCLKSMLLIWMCLNFQVVHAIWAEDGNAIAKDVPYVPTPPSVVVKMLEMAAVGPNDVVYDLGCGDGRIVITAVRDFGAIRGVGIDIDPQLIEESKANARLAGVDRNITFLVQDLFESDIRDASVVTLYLLSTVNLRLRPTLLTDLTPGTRVVSHAFDMGAWGPDDYAEESGSLIYFWVIPANVSGRWELLQADGKMLDLILEQEFQVVRGTVTSDGRRRELQQVSLNGNQLEFSLDGDVAATWTARVHGDRMEGHAAGKAWQATRVPETAYPLEPTDPDYTAQRQKLLNLQKQ